MAGVRVRRHEFGRWVIQHVTTCEEVGRLVAYAEETGAPFEVAKAPDLEPAIADEADL